MLRSKGESTAVLLWENKKRRVTSISPAVIEETIGYWRIQKSMDAKSKSTIIATVGGFGGLE